MAMSRPFPIGALWRPPCLLRGIARGYLQLALLGALALAGCRTVEPISASLIDSPAVVETARRVAVGSSPPPIDASQAIRRARAACRQGWLAELHGSDESVDRYYEGVAFAYAGFTTALEGSHEANRATSLYNAAIGDCLRAAQRFGRLDARSHLTVNLPTGSTVIPVAHKGFVWEASDFQQLLDPCAAPQNPSQHLCHMREGLGAPQVVHRENPQITASDRFLMDRSFFAATAILRPDLGPWLGNGEPSASPDVLELHDSIRVRDVELAGRKRPLAADLDASVAYAQEAMGSRQYTITGFLNPSLELQNASLRLAEPYQPGKVPFILVHGLLDNPYHFTDIVNSLRATPGLVDRFQIATFRYPTGTTFLRSGAMLRRDLHAFSSTFDPQGTDPGLQNSVMLGFSMGGMLTKLQITASGDELWKMACNVPLGSLVTTEETRAVLEKIFFFEPVPILKRVIFLATPHDGGSPPTRIAGRIASPMVRRPADTVAIVQQLQRDNPGLIRPEFAKIPTSVDLLTNQPPILETLRRLPVNPATTYHTILGTGYFPPPLDTGDTVVSITSARSDGAASEHHVRAVHFDICYKPEVIVEIKRILHVHLDELGMTPESPTPVAVGPSVARAGIRSVR
mgnify:CR=1 FL=1